MIIGTAVWINNGDEPGFHPQISGSGQEARKCRAVASGRGTRGQVHDIEKQRTALEGSPWGSEGSGLAGSAYASGIRIGYARTSGTGWGPGRWTLRHPCADVPESEAGSPRIIAA